jgi:hypothetical protein
LIGQKPGLSLLAGSGVPQERSVHRITQIISSTMGKSEARLFWKSWEVAAHLYARRGAQTAARQALTRQRRASRDVARACPGSVGIAVEADSNGRRFLTLSILQIDEAMKKTGTPCYSEQPPECKAEKLGEGYVRLA